MRTTGPEIWRQTEGKITHLFVSLGTCGTVSGTSRFLKEKNPDVKVVAIQPTEGHDVPGLRNVSQLGVSKLFDSSLVDDILEVEFRLAYTRAMELCQTEGLLAGPSSGLIYEGAREIIMRDKQGYGVMIFPDNIFKYTSNMMKHIPSLATGNEA
jgi:cysteine synthase B